MQKLYVMAGVNGAGKTTFARSFFPQNVTYLNPDLMVKTFLQNNQNNKKAKELDAWKDVVKIINAHINGEKTFGFETTLSDKTVIKKLHAAQKNGFEINLIYISLDDLDLHFKRVDHRVENGGHDIPKEIIARRFHSIPKYLPEAMSAADTILILNNTTSFQKIACIDQKKIVYQELILPEQIKKSITEFKSKPENKEMKNIIICEEKYCRIRSKGSKPITC